MIKHEDGREERQALLGESLAEAAPGYLPRTLNELRSGVTSSQDEIQNLNPIIHDLNTTAIDSFEIDPEDRIFDPPSPTHRSAILQTGQPPRLHAQEVSLTLPQDTSINHVTTAAQVSHQLERVAALRSELQRIRVGIELVIAGLHDLRGVFPDSEDALQDTSNLHNRVTNIQNLLTSAGQVQNSNQSGFSSSGSNMDTDEMEWTTDGSSRPSETQNPAPAARLGNTSRPSLQQLATSSGPRIEPYHTRIRSPPTPGPLAPLRRTPILTNSNTMPQGGTTQQSTSQVASTSTTGPSSNPVRTTGGQITGVSLAERELLALRRRRDHARETETQLNARRTAAARTLERARVELEVAMRERERAERTYDTVERTQSRNTRVWGTQEEMDRQGSNYVSPITSMFMSQSQSQSQQTGSVTSRSQRTVEEQMRDYQAAELRRAASRRAPPLEDHPSSDGPFSGSQPLFLPSDFRASRYSESEHESDSEDDDEDGNEDYNERLASSTAAEARIEATTRRAEPELGRPAGSLETGNRFRRAVTASRPSPSNVLRPRPRRAPQAPLSDEEETERLTGMLTQITADLRAEHPEGSWEEAEQRRQFNMIYASLFDDIDPRNPQSEARANGHPIGTALSDGAQAVLDELNYTSGRTARQNVPPRPRDINDPDELLSAAANRRRAAIDDRAHLAAARAYLDNYNISARRRTGRPPEELKSLDKKKDGRPEPANEEDMMIKMECKICFAQVATVAVLPCGMLALLFAPPMRKAFPSQVF